LVAEHSVQAPLSGPERWQAGRSGSGQLGAPSVVQATQVRVAIEQTGVEPPQCASVRQATQAPTPDEVSHRGAHAGQCDTSVAVQGAQAPLGKQIGVEAAHSESDAQARQICDAPSHTGEKPPQWPLERQPTHVPESVLQTGTVPPHRVALVAEHWPQAPPGWQAGCAPPHSESPPQARQAWKIRSHTGAAAPQPALSRHSTHTPAVA
jgi:hypothetical protein